MHKYMESCTDTIPTNRLFCCCQKVSHNSYLFAKLNGPYRATQQKGLVLEAYSCGSSLTPSSGQIGKQQPGFPTDLSNTCMRKLFPPQDLFPMRWRKTHVAQNESISHSLIEPNVFWIIDQIIKMISYPKLCLVFHLKEWPINNQSHSLSLLYFCTQGGHSKASKY